MSSQNQSYVSFFNELDVNTISKEAQEMILVKPESWNRYLEQAIMNTIHDGELPSGESRFYKAYFDGSHEKISLKSLKEVVVELEKASIAVSVKDGKLVMISDKVDKVTVLGLLADMFPKYE